MCVCMYVLYLEESLLKPIPIPDCFDLGPQREVISIYNDDFVTLPSKPQYFIEVYRCVEVDVGECFSGRYAYPVPTTTDEIEIIVPDITNKDLDSSDNKKFYKYVVYNHTSCHCGKVEDSKRKLYKTEKG